MSAVAAIARMPAPAYRTSGTAASSVTTMHATHGVCSLGLTFDNVDEAGSWSSRAMPKHSRITFAWIASRQMKMAIDTTTRYVVANAFEKFASITADGVSAP